MSQILDFVSLIIQAAKAASLKLSVRPYRRGAMITSLEPNGDLDRFLIEITNLADQDRMVLHLSLPSTNINVKNAFQQHSFSVVNANLRLQMERAPQGISYEELEFMESAPPGKKAERFIHNQKADFKKRYGKRWKKVLYATAWKQFESTTFKDYLALVEAIEDGN